MKQLLFIIHDLSLFTIFSFIFIGMFIYLMIAFILFLFKKEIKTFLKSLCCIYIIAHLFIKNKIIKKLKIF
jgi:hypothetical protein